MGDKPIDNAHHQSPSTHNGSTHPQALACPSCHGILSYRDERAMCDTCAATWRTRAGTYIFESSPFYWGEIPQDLMKTCLRKCRTQHWRDVLSQMLSPGYQEIMRYASSATRADWQYLLPLTRESTVLDLGAGWGSNTFPLAQRVGTVFALEKVAERLRFLEVRRRQDRVNNVVILGGDFHRLPLADNSIDVVICNGILEWVAVEKGGPPRKVQREFLEGLARVLKPGGTLLVGIENRFGLDAIRGAVDHSGFRYTSVMPRIIADMWVRLRMARSDKFQVTGRTVLPGYRTYTYTAAGLRRLLEEGGFCNVRAFAADESYNWPWNLMPVDEPGPRLFWLRQRGKARRHVEIMRKCGLRKTEARLRNLLASYLVTVAKRKNK